MNFEINNLGIIKNANIEFKNFTIITGNNNSGKTFLSQSYYGLIKALNSQFFINLSEENLKKLIEEKTLTLLFQEYSDQIRNKIQDIVINYQNTLHNTFASEKKHFINTTINFSLEESKYINKKLSIHFFGQTEIKINKENNNITINLKDNIKNQEKDIDSDSNIISYINQSFSIFLKTIIFPNVTYLGAERNSLLKFQIDIDGNRSELINYIQDFKQDNVNQFLENKTGQYPLIIRDELSRIRRFRQSDILNSFYNENIEKKIIDLIGGKFKTEDKKILFSPKINPTIELNLSETSSSSCSLFGLYNYIKNYNSDSILFIDEPEMNLHPKNQRLLARLLVILINSNLNIVISTHSDIIIREINTMILLNNPNKQHIREEEGYSKFETLDVKKLNCYTTAQNEDFTYSLKQIPVSQEQGISVESFDKTIEEINRIQDRLLWE